MRSRLVEAVPAPVRQALLVLGEGLAAVSVRPQGLRPVPGEVLRELQEPHSAGAE
jgi:hypothetical protein